MEQEGFEAGEDQPLTQSQSIIFVTIEFFISEIFQNCCYIFNIYLQHFQVDYQIIEQRIYFIYYQI